jgi:hypothetical protein
MFRVEFLYPEDGGSAFLRNVCNALPDYTVSRSRRQSLLVCSQFSTHMSNANLVAGYWFSLYHFLRVQVCTFPIKIFIIGCDII